MTLRRLHSRMGSKVSLRLVPISLAQANEHVAAWHRHNEPVIACIFRVGVCDENGVLRAVAIAGLPKARMTALDADTIEINRVASDGTKNACSMLYGACTRAAFALGYRRVVTYTQADESGSSLRAAGYRVIAQRPPSKGWARASRPRTDPNYRNNILDSPERASPVPASDELLRRASGALPALVARLVDLRFRHLDELARQTLEPLERRTGSGRVRVGPVGRWSPHAA